MKNSQETIITKFLKLEASGGIILMVAAVIALVLANTPLNSYYALLIDTPVEIIALIALLAANIMLTAIVYSYVFLYVEKGKAGFAIEEVWHTATRNFFKIFITSIIAGILIVFGFTPDKFMPAFSRKLFEILYIPLLEP